MDSPCHVFVKHSLSDTSFRLTAPFRGMLLTPESVLMMLSPNDVSAPWKSREHYRLYEPFVHSNTELARRTRRYQKFHWTTGFDRTHGQRRALIGMLTCDRQTPYGFVKLFRE